MICLWQYKTHFIIYFVVLLKFARKKYIQSVTVSIIDVDNLSTQGAMPLAAIALAELSEDILVTDQRFWMSKGLLLIANQN